MKTDCFDNFECFPIR